MRVDRYLFQSPYSSMIQIGRPDPSAVAKDEFELSKQANKTLQDAKTFEVSNQKDTDSSAQSNRLLDVYA